MEPSLTDFERLLEEARRQTGYFRRLAQECGNRRLREAEQLSRVIERLRRAEAEVEASRDQLELRVRERTAELRQANAQLTREIAERQRVEHALRESEQKFRDFVETTSDWIWEIDASGNYSYASPRVRELLGYEPDEVLGRSPFEFMPPEEADRVQTEFGRAVSERRPFYGLVNVNRRKDGRWVVLETSGVPRVDEQGRLLGFHGIDRDITQRKQTEQEQRELDRRLLQSQKLESLGVLAGGVAHDFNNLLAAILGNADLALADLSPTSPAGESLREIKETSIRAADLCRQMLAYAGKGRFVTVSLCLNDLIVEMLPLVRSSLSKKAQLHLQLAGRLPALHGDPTQVRQVIMNLLVNASESLGDNSGHIHLSTGVKAVSVAELETGVPGETPAEGCYVWLEVSDSGSGMDAETQRRIFEPFFTTKFTGRGLGLPAALGIVRGHQGALTFRSELGKGSTFRVLFPAVSPESPSSHLVGAATEGAGSTRTILLVDDEAAVRTTGKRLLERLGFQVLVAGDGREAMDVYRQRGAEIALVLLDLTMPRLSGEETFRELVQLNPNVRVIVSSGYSETEITPRFPPQGLAGFVQKPYTLDELSRKLKAALPALDLTDGGD